MHACETLAKKGPFSFGSLYDPPTMAGITVLVMKGGHDERVERGGEGGARRCGAGGLKSGGNMHPCIPGPPVGQPMGLPSISRGEEAKLAETAQIMSQCQSGPHPCSWQRPLWC